MLPISEDRTLQNIVTGTTGLVQFEEIQCRGVCIFYIRHDDFSKNRVQRATNRRTKDFMYIIIIKSEVCTDKNQVQGNLHLVLRNVSIYLKNMPSVLTAVYD